VRTNLKGVYAMSDSNIGQAEAKTPEVKPVPAKTKGKAATNGKAKETKPGKAGKKFEFSGHVEGINIKGDGASGNQFLFSIAKKKGEHRSYTIDSSNPARYDTMTRMVLMAFKTGAKLHLNSAPGVGPTPFAGEIEVRAKS
jgi:hypothetical protein